MHHSQQGLPRPGDVLAGRFRVERLVGAGGMGSVYAARDVRTGYPVAVKLMLPEHVQSAELSGRFVREARAAAALTSRHVARVYEVGQLPDGALFMTMELLQGDDLARTLRRRGPLPIPEAVVYLLETCDAIAEAHALGIVHRDLKPGNLFLAAQQGSRPIIKVLDFGISKATKLGAGGETPGLTATDSALGSPQYMSPEQLRSAKRVDHRTDIWSLGIILHKLLTGVLAFEADSVGAHLAMIVADPPTPLRRRLPDAPVELEQVILRCLQKDLSLRFQNVGQLAVALSPFAPAEARGLVERIVGIVGRQAAYAPLPSCEAGVLPAWVPSVTPPPAVRAPQPSVVTVASGGSGGGARLTAIATMAVFAGVAVLAVVAVVVTLRPREPQTSPAAGVAPPAASSVGAIATGSPGGAPAATGSPSGAPAPAVQVHIVVEIEPGDATLELDGAPVQGHVITLPRGDEQHKLVARAPGYADETRDVSAREDTAVAIVLHHPDGGVLRGPLRKKMKGPVETSL